LAGESENSGDCPRRWKSAWSGWHLRRGNTELTNICIASRITSSDFVNVRPWTGWRKDGNPR
jgi:hypothetical protein